MIKAVLFDLDGVLIDAREWHKEALNDALIKHGYSPISEEDHLKVFDGLPTKVKLSMLDKLKLVDKKDFQSIENLKQELTIEHAIQKASQKDSVVELLKTLKGDGYKIACCSNSIRKTIMLFLGLSQIDSFFDLILSNQDVKKPKPDPEIYIKAMKHFNLSPEEVLICEDSSIGIASAKQSLAHILVVKTPEDLTKDFVYNEIRNINASA